MPIAIALVLALVIGVFVYLRIHGYVYFGRTQAGWTSVRDDVRVMGERIRVLVIEGTYQSATYLDRRWADPVFTYHELFDHMCDAWPQGDGPQRVAVLGGGGYAIPKHLIVHHPEIRHLDVVELDPAIEQLARRFFFLDNLEALFGAETSGRLSLHVGDALSWLTETDQTYDAIINDCFSALEPDEALMTPQAARVLSDHLTPQGVYLTNVVSALEGSNSYVLYATISAITSSFEHVWVYPCSPRNPMACDNNIVVAAHRPYHFADAWEWPTERSTS